MSQVKPWFNSWLRNLVAYCAIMGVPVPRTFAAAFKLVPPPRQDTQP
jgi:hypothetical protein